MDPSEFEGTIEREAEVINAGVLENLLTTDQPKFQCLDLLKESQDIYLAIYNLQNLLKQKDKIHSFQQIDSSLQQEMDEFSTKMIEMKESYLTRRQHLKQFVKEFLIQLSTSRESLLRTEKNAQEIGIASEEERISFVSLIDASEKIVSEFKVEYDYIATINKYLESNALKLLKYFELQQEEEEEGELKEEELDEAGKKLQKSSRKPDYETIINESLTIVLKSQEIIKNAQEQLNIAEKILHSSSIPGHNNNDQQPSSSTTYHLPSISKIVNFIANKEKSFSSLSSPNLLLFDSSREHSSHNNNSDNMALPPTGNKFPSSTNGNGGNGIGGGIASNHYSYDELHEHYQLEINSLKNKYEMELKNQSNRQLIFYQDKELQLTKQLEGTIQQKEQEIQQLLSLISNYELKSQLLVEQEKMISNEKEKKLNLEEKIRQQLFELTDLQNLMLTKDQQHKELQQQFSDLQSSYQMYKDSMEEKFQSLEKRFNEQSAQLQICQQVLLLLPKEEEIQLFAKEIGFSEDSKDYYEESDDKDVKERSQMRSTSASALTWNQLEQFIQRSMRRLNNDVITYRLQVNDFNKKYELLEVSYQDLMKKAENYEVQIKLLEDEIKFSDRSPASGLTSHQQSFPANAISGSQNHSFLDLELSTLLNPVHASSSAAMNKSSKESQMSVPSTGTGLVSEDYVSILQQQRNHYMSRTESLQQELHQYKGLVSKLEEEKEQLTNENMELYRRLRVVRAMNSNNNPNSSSFSNQEMRSRRHDVYGNEPPADHIDQKYLQLYEANELNPYKIIELEKKQYVASMNVFERTIIVIYHFIMKDSYLRNMFLMYLVFIHFLSCLYVFQVLNPQLVEEVDQHLKNKWSAETFGLSEHPDLLE